MTANKTKKSYRLPNGVISVKSSSDFLDLMDDYEKGEDVPETERGASEMTANKTNEVRVYRFGGCAFFTYKQAFDYWKNRVTPEELMKGMIVRNEEVE